MSRLFARGLAVGFVAALAVAAPVSAHAGLDVSVPASGAVLSEAPEEFLLDFDEPVQIELGGVTLADSEGRPIALAPPRIGDDDTTVVVPDVPDLGNGVYVVVWQVVSADGHPSRGAFTFQIGISGTDIDTDALVASALDGSSASAVVRWALGVSRFLATFGVVVLVGSVLAQALVGRGDATRRVRLTWTTGVVLAVVGSAAMFVLQGPYLTAGRLGDAVDTGLWSDVVNTRLGTALLLRLALLGVAAALVRRAATPHAATWSVVSAAIVLTFSSTGHPSATSPAALGVVVDALHLAGICVWFGGLTWLVAARPDHSSALRYSRAATVAIPAVVATGVVQTLLLVDGFGDVTDTTWGRALLVKVAVVVVITTLGGAARWLLHHDGTHGVARIAATEMLLGVAVLGLTAGLVATSPTPPPSSAVFSATLAQGSLIADVSVTPGRVGDNEVHVVLSPPGGTLQPVQSAEARISLASADIPPVPVVLRSDGPNHYIGDVQVPSSGDWRLEIVVLTQDNSTVRLSTTVPVPG